jgi:hypothetical protein
MIQPNPLASFLKPETRWSARRQLWRPTQPLNFVQIALKDACLCTKCLEYVCVRIEAFLPERDEPMSCAINASLIHLETGAAASALCRVRGSV